MQIESILTPSLIELGYEIVQRTKDGWEIDENRVPVLLGWQYEVGFIKYTEEELATVKLKEDAFPAEAAKRKPGRPAKTA